MRHLFLVVAYLFSGAAVASDTVKYQTELTLLPGDSALSAVTTIEIPERYLTSDTVALFLNKDFSVASLTGPNVVNFTVEQSNKVPVWNEVTIEFSEPAKATPLSVRIEYSGSIDNDAQHGNFITSNQVHLSIDSAWHPVFSDLSTPIIGTVSVDLGDYWQVFGPGEVTRSESRYQVEGKERTIDVSLYAEKEPARIDNDGFTVIYDDSNAKMAEFVSSAGLQCFKQLNKRFGEHAPLKSAQTILLERPGPSFARGNYISLSAQTLGDEVHTHQYLCHELAHNWTNYTSAMSHDYWMVESFAEYISAREIARIYHEEEFNNIVKKWQARAERESFVWRPDTDRRASHKVNYGLGPIALMRLHEQLGDKAFKELIGWYMTTNVTETEELIAKVASLADVDTERWFSALLTGNNP